MSTTAEKPVTPEFPTIVVPAGAWGSLQTLFNDGVFSTSNNLAKGDKPCEADHMLDGVLVKCPHRAVIQAIHIAECEACHRKQKKTEQKLCLPHAAVHFGAHEPVNAQTRMPFAEHHHNGHGQG